jgi:hypothetical protein
VIIVRTVFQADYGKGGELAAEFKKVAAQIGAEIGGSRRWRILTDLSGSFDTVVQELELESLAEWEQMRPRLFASTALRDAIATARGMTDSGRTEFWTVEAQS